MRCNKCGAIIPDDKRLCPVCGHKLQSGRGPGAGETGGDDAFPPDNGESRRLLDFQGWAKPGRGSGPYIEACVYAAILAGGVIWCLVSGVMWPLYPLLGILALAAWLRRL